MCPLITMSAVTGNPNATDIYEYMFSLKTNGIDEVLLYPRSGCEIEYLSDNWFDTVSNFIDTAIDLDMKIWLYDDFNWPSGDAGGRVTKIPEYRLLAIKVTGDGVGEISAKSLHNSNLFGEKYFPNLLFPQAVDYFIACTHEEYYKRFKNHFGTTIKGIFTDEPSVGYACKDGYLPYYEGIEKDYFNHCGRDFYEDINSQNDDLFVDGVTVISNRFKSCYIDKISLWCKEHGILFTGHLMCDHNPIESVRHSGHTLKNLSSFLLPGIDDIYTNFKDESEMALFGTAEYAATENGAMAELFALGPCNMPYAKKRASLYLCACHKINHYFLAISHMDMRGNYLVRDYFNTFSADQPNFQEVKDLSVEAKKAALFAKNDFIPDVYIRFPFNEGASHIKKSFDTTPLARLINELTYRQIQWKFTTADKKNAPIIEVSKDLDFTVDKKPLDLDLIKHNIIVTDKNGDTPQGIFVRRFINGEFVVINLFSEDKEFFIKGQEVYLNKYDVYFSKEPTITKPIPAKSLEDFSVSYNGPNIIRTMHPDKNSVCEIYCSKDEKITLITRNDEEITVNGDKVFSENPAPSHLPKGLRCLYKSCELTLKKGKNIIFSGNDLKYLPSLFVSGNFKYKAENDSISRLYISSLNYKYLPKEEIEGFGSVELTSKIDIPVGAKELYILGTDLLTLVYLNGKELEKLTHTHGAFKISEEFSGKLVDIKILQYSSIAPIFGDVDFWDIASKNVSWRGTPSPIKESFGFSSIAFEIED